MARPSGQSQSHAIGCADSHNGRSALEFLAHYCEHGQTIREGSVRYVEGIQADPAIVVLHQSHHSFQTGLSLYKARPDKGYSLTDCISMQTMRQEGIPEILTHDNHFTQEGFTVLL
jgi:predicted nucleic acid-binding protein